jgi:protein ImuB
MLSKDTINSAMTSNMQRYQRPQRFCQSVYFNHDIDRVDSLLFPLKRLLGELEHFLHLQQFDTTRLTLRLEHRKQDDTLWHFNSVLPSHQAAHFLQLIHIRFEQQTLPAPTIALCLSCDQLSPRQALADDLFIQQYQQSSGKLIDLLQSRLGQEALWSPGVNNDPRPEKAWCKCQPGKGQIGQRLAERPLWLQASPSPIDIRHYHILSSGERISAGWWQNTPVRRDYVSALHIGKDLRHQDKKQQQHTRHWLFRDDQGRYYLHGIFA